jgi:hypothetical protein
MALAMNWLLWPGSAVSTSWASSKTRTRVPWSSRFFRNTWFSSGDSSRPTIWSPPALMVSGDSTTFSFSPTTGAGESLFSRGLLTKLNRCEFSGGSSQLYGRISLTSIYYLKTRPTMESQQITRKLNPSPSCKMKSSSTFPKTTSTWAASSTFAMYALIYFYLKCKKKLKLCTYDLGQKRSLL